MDRFRLARAARAGTLTRLADGCYADRVAYETANAWEQFRLRSIALVTACGPLTFLAEWSAVSVWTLPTIGPPPATPVVVQAKRPGLGASPSSVGRIRVAQLPSEEMLTRGSSPFRTVPIMSPAWAVADLARNAPVLNALVATDDALHSGEPVREMAHHFAGWDGVARMRWVLEHADPAAESPLESLGRFACIQFNLPMPVSNAWLGRDGPERRVDLLWVWHWVAGEGDGALKYDNRPDASRIVADQNEREWQLRRLGLDFARFGWDPAYFHRAELAAKFGAALQDNPPRVEPIRWWKHFPGKGPVEPEPADVPPPHPQGIILPPRWNETR